MIKWLANPFYYIAGSQALLIGLLIMLLTSTGAFYSDMHFDGAVDAHFGPPAKLTTYMIEQLIAWSCPVIIFYLTAFLLTNSKFRMIDIAGTLALARTPMILVVLIASLTRGHIKAIKLDQIDNITLIVSLMTLLMVIWMIALMFHAYTVSFNLKGTRAVLGFIICMILAEMLSLVVKGFAYRITY